MRNLLASAAMTAALVTSLSAQGPYTIEDPAPDADMIAAMTTAGLTISTIGQVELLPLPVGYPVGPVGTPNVYFLMVTSDYSGPGAVGGWDALSAWYDRSVSPPVFTRTTEFDTINTPDDEFQVSMSADLLIAVLDRGIPGLRAAISVHPRDTAVDFATATPMSGVPTGYIDPHLCKVNGVWTVMWAAPSNAIAMGDLDPTTGAVTNVGVASPASTLTGASFNHSPSAIKNGDEAVAMIHSTAVSGAGSLAMFQQFVDRNPGIQPEPIIDSRDPSFITFYPNSTGSDWIANPDANGGEMTYAISATGGYGDPVTIGLLGMGGDAWPAAGGPVSLSAFAPPSDNGLVPDYLVWFGFAASRAATPTPIAPVNGLLGLDFGTATILDQFAVVDAATGIGSIGFPLPAGVLSVGTQVPFQPIFVQLITGNTYFGNVAEIEAR